MAEDRIDSIIDLQKVQAELDATSKGVKDLVALIQSVKGKGLDIMAATNVSEVNKLQKELGGLTTQVNNSTASIIATNKAVRDSTESLKVYTGQTAKLADTVKQNIKQSVEYKQRLSEISNELADLKLARNALGQIGVTDANRDQVEKELANNRSRVEVLTEEQKQVKLLSSELDKFTDSQIKQQQASATATDTLKGLEAELENLRKIRDTTLTVGTKEFDEANVKIGKLNELIKASKASAENNRPYKQLALAFAAAAKEAQDLGVKYGTMDKRSQAAAKKANELNNQLKQVDYTLGNFQRNVGNYPKGLDKIGTSISNLSRNFLGLIGITSLGALFSSSIDEFVEMEKNVRQLQNTLKNLGVPEAFGRIEVAAEKLQKQFGYLDNDDILKTFNQLVVYGKLTEKQINELIPVIIDFAAASGQDLASATSLIIKSLEGNGKALKEYGINMKDAKSTTEAFSIIMEELKPRVDGVAASFAESSSGGLAKAKQDFKDLKEEIGAGLLPVLNKLLTFFNEAIKGAQMLAKDIGLLFSGGTDAVRKNFDEETTKAAVKNIEDKFRLLDANQRIDERNKLQIAIGEQNKLLKDLSVGGKLFNEGLSSPARIEQINKKIDFNKKLLDVLFKLQNEGDPSGKVLGIGDPNAGFGKGKTDDAAKKAADLAERIRKAEFETTKALQEERVKIQEEIFKDESKSFDERIAALREFVQEKARLIKLERTFEKGAKGLLKAEIEAIEADKQTELNELLRNGHDEYNKILGEKKKEEEKIHKETADRIKKIHEDLQNDIEKGLKEASDRLKAELDKRDEIEKEKAGLKSQLVEETEGLIFDILTASFDRQKNEIQDQIDLLEKKKQKDIEVANATITNAVDRAAAITVIEARAAAERVTLEQKQRQIDLQRARFEKAESIASIITKTAEAVIATLAKTPPPAGLPLAFLIGAIGAAQLARVVATPIPKFRDGGTHKGGLMIVGDGGKAEGIELPDGTVLKSPSTSTLMEAPKGTKVHADYSKMMLKATVTNVPVYKEVSRSDDTAKEVKLMRGEVVKAIRKIPQQQITVQNVISKRIRSGNSTQINAS